MHARLKCYHQMRNTHKTEKNVRATNCSVFKIRNHGVFRHHKHQRWLTRHEWAIACCVQTGTNHDAHRCSAATAREIDMWSLATRAMHEAAQVLKENKDSSTNVQMGSTEWFEALHADGNL